MKTLLEAGVHFGHQTRRWDPKMRPFIFTERNGIHIIDLQQTVRRLEDAMTWVREFVANGGTIMFVGTKKQAQETIEEEARRCGMPFVNRRWMGGMLTNFQTILNRIRRLEQLDQMRDDGDIDRLPKKEGIKMLDELERLERLLTGKIADAVLEGQAQREAASVDREAQEAEGEVDVEQLAVGGLVFTPDDFAPGESSEIPSSETRAAAPAASTDAPAATPATPAATPAPAAATPAAPAATPAPAAPAAE